MLPLSSVQASEADILREIRRIREDMKLIREDMNKRFAQIMWFFGLWVPLSMAIVGYILQKLNRHDDRYFELSRKLVDAEDIIYAIEKADTPTKKRLKGILKN